MVSGCAEATIGQNPRSSILQSNMGRTISRRLKRIAEVIDKHPHLKGQNKLFCATPYEEAYATAISRKAHDDVKNAMILIAFGGSCLHVLSVNQDERNNLAPGPNSVLGLSADIVNGLNTNAVGTEKDWLNGHEPPLPPKGTFYITYPLDEDLDKRQYMLLAHLFEELNRSIVQENGAYLVCGAPTNINPNDGDWWPDKSPRVVRTTFDELARHSALPQIKNHNNTGINHGGLLSDRHNVNVDGGGSTTVHEMILSAMAAPKLAIEETPAPTLPAIGLAMKYFKDSR